MKLYRESVIKDCYDCVRLLYVLPDKPSVARQKGVSMKKYFLSLIVSLFTAGSLFAADLTVEGTVSKVVPAKKEIYVLADGKKHEFYFKDNTELLQNGEPAEFSALKVDQKVKVEAKKVGRRFDPLKVEILQ
jgi:hypothetical protein